MMRHRADLPKLLWGFGMALVGISAAVQVASITFWLPLEIYQLETFHRPAFVLGLRFENMLAFAMGKMDAWGLTNQAMTEDPWDYVHITTWNFLPFLLRRVGAAPGWVVQVAFAAWFASLAALGAVLWRLRQVLGRLR
jgi:hypothetical protein